MSVFISHSESETVLLAQKIADTVKRGTILALYGTLGTGKTAFSRGFIQYLTRSKTDVPSPTFTLLQTYETETFPIYHFDMYRLKTPDEAYELGIEEAFSEGVSLIEWPDKIDSLLPKKHIKIHFEIQQDGSRRIIVEE